jgi:Flp pilus assembly protein TadG
MRRHSLLRDARGLGTIEFALLAPVMFALFIAIFQLGTLYFANADLRNAVAHGARYASIFPRPTTDQVKARVSARVDKLQANKITGPDVTYGTDSNGYQYAEIEMKYAVPLNFVFFSTPAVTLTDKRRVFLQPTS